MGLFSKIFPNVVKELQLLKQAKIDYKDGENESRESLREALDRAEMVLARPLEDFVDTAAQEKSDVRSDERKSASVSHLRLVR